MSLISRMVGSLIRTGTLRIVDADGKVQVLAGSATPSVTIRLSDSAVFRKLLLKPELAAGEAYMDGTLTIEEGSLYELLELIALNRSSLRSYPMHRLARTVSRRLRSLHQRNPASKALKNVAHHYDLSRELYRLFLDDDLQYSCAYFVTEQDSLEQAQQNKKRHIAAKLLLRPGQRVLDIGCGWGGMALFLAAQADVAVTGVTLSREQLEIAQARARDLGLADRVRFELRDYREVEGQFDRIVSVGMFEHVGVDHYDEFFTKMRRLLAPDGVALLHSIGRRGRPGATSPWIRKYIFPGGYVPALSEVCGAVERQRLWVTDIEILLPHYADTLRAWRARFEANRAPIAQLYDERFCRMWEFYLAGSELAFRHGSHMVFQMQLTRQRNATPRTRDYIGTMEESIARAGVPA